MVMFNPPLPSIDFGPQPGTGLLSGYLTKSWREDYLNRSWALPLLIDSTLAVQSEINVALFLLMHDRL
jgi:hypothetical protein